MSNFAEIDENNVVIRVLVGNPELNDLDAGKEIAKLLGGKWVQTSYNNRIRGNYAATGYWYLEKEDLFVIPKCHENATLNIGTAQWDCSDEVHNVQLH